MSICNVLFTSLLSDKNITVAKYNNHGSAYCYCYLQYIGLLNRLPVC